MSSAQSVTGRAASPVGTADGGSRHLGLALLVIATAQRLLSLTEGAALRARNERQFGADVDDMVVLS